MTSKRIALVLAVCVLLAVPAWPDDKDKPKEKKKLPPYALIFGTVWATDGTPAAGIRIKIRRVQDKKPKWELISDRRGEFAQRLPAGKGEYVVWADVKPKGKRPETHVQVENDERVDIGLHLIQ